MSDPKSVKNVCVIGAGTMGCGIAAHLANLGLSVSLLDIAQPNLVEGFERAKQARPPHFLLPETAGEIRLGTVGENVGWISEADWVCEAIVERLGAKRSLFARIEPHLKIDAYVSTNTSGLEISMISDGMSEFFRRRFIGTHFFNPPRYLKLLELIPTPDTDPSVVQEMTQFLEDTVAKRVVLAKDTPGFIANRYGMWCMFHAIHVAEKLRLSVEQVDAITGSFLGRPKTASFRLNDLVGLDVMTDIAQNLIERCPNDPHIQVLKTPMSMMALIDRGWLGEKSGQGYYRREGKEPLVLDLGTLAYRQATDPRLPALKELGSLPLAERIDKALGLRDETGEFLRHYLIPALKYADYLKEEISHSVLDFDRVMEWGFGWQMGPFAITDAVVSARTGGSTSRYYDNAKVKGFDGVYVDIKRDSRYLKLEECPVVGTGDCYNVRNLGADVVAISLTTKLGVITPLLVEELTLLLEAKRYDRFVLTSESRSFSGGFDLRFFAKAIAEERWIDIDGALAKLQRLGELLEETNSVAAIFGHTLGAGLELALSCPKIVASVESQIGFPEAKVGLLPAGRGLTLMRLYNQFTAKRLSEVTRNMAIGAVSDNSEQARVLGYLRSTDQTVFHPDRVLHEAKIAAFTVKPLKRPNISAANGPLSGMIDRLLEESISKGESSAYDEMIGQKMKHVMAKVATYEDCLAKERSEFLDLCSKALTVARINHMLENGKPLKN